MEDFLLTYRWMEGRTLVIRWSPGTLPSFLVFRSKRVDRVVFTVHENCLGAVALTGCIRGDHTHLLASYFLVRSSTTALRLLSGEYRCFVLVPSPSEA